MPLAADSFKMVPSFTQILQNIKDRFSEAGWEGDGDIKVLWLPPFVGVGVEDTWGRLLWHVKQSNDGISWIASAIPLRFPSLSEEKAKMAKRIAKPDNAESQTQNAQGGPEKESNISDIISKLEKKNFDIGKTGFTLKDIFVYLGEFLAAGVTSASITSKIDEYASYDDRTNVFSEYHEHHEIIGPLIIMGLVKVQPPSGEWVELLYLTEKGKSILNKLDNGR